MITIDVSSISSSVCITTTATTTTTTTITTIIIITIINGQSPVRSFLTSEGLTQAESIL